MSRGLPDLWQAGVGTVSPATWRKRGGSGMSQRGRLVVAHDQAEPGYPRPRPGVVTPPGSFPYFGGGLGEPEDSHETRKHESTGQFRGAVDEHKILSA